MVLIPAIIPFSKYVVQQATIKGIAAIRKNLVLSVASQERGKQRYLQTSYREQFGAYPVLFL